MLELPGPPLILQDFSILVRFGHPLAHYQDVKGAFVGSPFLVSKNQNWTIFGSDFPFNMECDFIEKDGERMKEAKEVCAGLYDPPTGIALFTGETPRGWAYKYMRVWRNVYVTPTQSQQVTSGINQIYESFTPATSL